MSLEEQVAAFYAVKRKIDELEAEKKALSEAILEQMKEKKERVGNFSVCRYDTLSIKTTLDEARHYGAVVLKEAIDREKIKNLHKSGQSVEGVKQTHYIRVSEIN